VNDNRDRVLQSILNGGDKDFRDTQDNDSLKDTKYDKREFEFSE